MPHPNVEKHSQCCHSKADREQIAKRAYYKWLEAGAPQNHDGKCFWYAAERELTKADVTLEEVIEVEVHGQEVFSEDGAICHLS